MKQTKKIMAGLAVAAGLMAFSIPAFAEDYNSYSLEQLSQMRTQMRTASPEEKAQFQNAWRNKMQNASPEERQLYSRGGRGQGSGSRTCDGTGPKGRAYRNGGQGGAGAMGGGNRFGGGHGRGGRR